MLYDFRIRHINAYAKSFVLMQNAVYYQIMNMNAVLCFLNLRKLNFRFIRLRISRGVIACGFPSTFGILLLLQCPIFQRPA